MSARPPADTCARLKIIEQESSKDWELDLYANGGVGITPAEIIEKSVCFIWYGKLLKILQSFKQLGF